MAFIKVQSKVDVFMFMCHPSLCSVQNNLCGNAAVLQRVFAKLCFHYTVLCPGSRFTFAEQKIEEDVKRNLVKEKYINGKPIHYSLDVIVDGERDRQKPTSQ